MKNFTQIDACFLGSILCIAAACFLPALKSPDTIDFKARLARCELLANKADGNLERSDVDQMIEDCLDDKRGH